MALWMAWTVDSILTTTPFFMPDDACMPVPTISSLPSGPATPTIATTLEVPMSSPTIICSLLALAIYRPLQRNCPSTVHDYCAHGCCCSLFGFHRTATPLP